MELQQYSEKIGKSVKSGSIDEAQSLLVEAVREWGLKAVEGDSDLNALGQEIEMQLTLSPAEVIERVIDSNYQPASTAPLGGKKQHFLRTQFETGEHPE